MAEHGTDGRGSAKVTETSDAMDLKDGVFRERSPRRIAASLERSAERSHRRQADPLRPAMPMPTFHLDRAGRNLPARRRRVLDKAKDWLRQPFGRRKSRSARPRCVAAVDLIGRPEATFSRDHSPA